MTFPQEAHASFYTHINGSLQDQLDRFAILELCKGWPLYRDASEWKNYRSIFAKEAYIWTTWTGPLPIDTFISISQAGKERGVFIMHRECGTLVNLGRPATGRALGKMKATITHRFVDVATNTQYDVDCDCRFICFVEKVPIPSSVNGENGGNGENGAVVGTEWKIKYVKLFYEKDKVLPADGYTCPKFEPSELEKYPEGYKFLGAAQARLGYEIDVHLPTARNEELWVRMYAEMEKWLDGKEVDLFWEPGAKDAMRRGAKIAAANGHMPVNGGGEKAVNGGVAKNGDGVVEEIAR